MTLQLARLNELCAGKLDSLNYDRMRTEYPDEYNARLSDKLNYRYPGVGGESYQDVILRLDEVILMMEQSRDNMIVICDRAVLRVLLSYFLGEERAKIPYMEVGAGVVELRRTHAGFHSTHTHIADGAATRAAGPGTNTGSQATNSLEHPPSPRMAPSDSEDSKAPTPRPASEAAAGERKNSFVESPFPTKAEYERWLRDMKP